MIVIEIPLQDVIIDVNKGINLAKVSEEQAILNLTQAYQFLPAPLSVSIENGIATITSAGRGLQRIAADVSDVCGLQGC